MGINAILLQAFIHIQVNSMSIDVLLKIFYSRLHKVTLDTDYEQIILAIKLKFIAIWKVILEDVFFQFTSNIVFLILTLWL